MKKAFYSIAMAVLMAAGSPNFVNAQEQPEPKKDTVNMDTNAKPEFYYTVEDENSGGGKSSGAMIAIIVGAVVVLAGGAFVVLKKKK